MSRVRVHVPTPLRSYTGGEGEVEAEGDDVAAVLRALDRRYPGMRFRVVDEQDRIRTHMKIFVGGEMARDLAVPVPEGGLVTIICALSGGTGAPSVFRC